MLYCSVFTAWKPWTINPSNFIPAREEVELVPPLENLRGSSSPGRLKHNQSNADSNVAESCPKKAQKSSAHRQFEVRTHSEVEVCSGNGILTGIAESACSICAEVKPSSASLSYTPRSRRAFCSLDSPRAPGPSVDAGEGAAEAEELRSRRRRRRSFSDEIWRRGAAAADEEEEDDDEEGLGFCFCFDAGCFFFGAIWPPPRGSVRALPP